MIISISDHLAQFLIILLDIDYVPKKINLYKRDTKKFDRENFFLDLISIDWDAVLKLETENPKEIKQQYKPWIKKEILSSIRKREKFYTQFIKAKDKVIKEEYHKKCKELRNQILNQCRQSIKAYFQKFFLESAKNVKNTWKGIKSIINVNSKSKVQPTSRLVKNELISDPKIVADTFNK